MEKSEEHSWANVSFAQTEPEWKHPRVNYSGLPDYCQVQSYIAAKQLSNLPLLLLLPLLLNFSLVVITGSEVAKHPVVGGGGGCGRPSCE